MSSLLSCYELEKSFGGPPLFSRIALNVMPGEKIGVLGPNGAGKTTLLRILAGIDAADSGEIIRKNGLRLAYLHQRESFSPNQTVLDFLLASLAQDHCPEDEQWSRIGTVTNALGLEDLDTRCEVLSGGWKKRVSLAAQLIRQPDLLLLDEPTNHLDLEGINWLEDYIIQADCAVVLISHDRALLENATTRIFEINRIYPQGCFTAPGNYSKFLERREDFLVGLSRYEESLRNKVRREIEWLKRGAKARTTKARGRIKQAERLIDELKESESRNAGRKNVDIDFQGSGRRTKKLIEATDLSSVRNGRTLFSKLDLLLSPGTRLGIVGVNGSGKSTLLKILNGQLKPENGSVVWAPDLRVVAFDQNREQLDPELPLKKALSPDSDEVIYRDRPIHVASYATRFLFRSNQLLSPVRSLSGGEQARLLIAKLMLQPADVLLLDEPTNDLDIETLQVLEESLDEFPGAVVLVTHDRFMLDRVSSSVLGLGQDSEPVYFANYAQWEESLKENRQSSMSNSAASVETSTATASQKEIASPLTSSERKELNNIQRRIQKLEDESAKLKLDLNDPKILEHRPLLEERCSQIQRIESELEKLIERWSELESRN